MQKEILIYKTPLRRQIEGLCLVFLGSLVFVYSFSPSVPNDFSKSVLFAIGLFVTFFGFYRAISYQLTYFSKGSSKVRQLKFHFGFIKREKEYQVNSITAFPDDLYSFTWAVFAYEEDIEPRQVLPENRLIVINSIRKKQASEICQEVAKLCPIQYKGSKK